MTHHYVYLFHTQKFVDSKEPVYKIGKTTQPNFERFNQYDEGALFHFQMSCHNCHDMEKKMITLFKEKYELHCGREYFKGNRHRMVKDICRFILEEDDPEIEEVAQYWFDEVVVNNEIDKKTDDEKVDDEKVDDEKTDDEKVEGDLPITIVSSTTLNSNFCVPCGYPCRSKSNFAKHCSTKKHKDTINPVAVIEGEFKCKNCVKTYKSNQGLWGHNKKCKSPDSKPDSTPIKLSETDLLAKIDNLNVIIQELSQILHVNDGDITEENIDGVSNVNSSGVELVSLDDNKNSFTCVPCGYSSCRKFNFKKHCSTKIHKDTISPVAVIEGLYKCKNCDMTYKSNQGLWAHNKKCKPAVIAEVPKTDLRAKIDNLERVIIDMTNQQLVNNKVIQPNL